MELLRSARNLAFATLCALALAGPARSQAYDGDWEGVLEAGGQKLRLALHVRTQGGETTAILDSLDQGATIPASAVKLENGELQILFMPIMGELKGKLSADGKTLDARWTQGQTFPLKMVKSAK